MRLLRSSSQETSAMDNRMVHVHILMCAHIVGICQQWQDDQDPSWHGDNMRLYFERLERWTGPKAVQLQTDCVGVLIIL